MKSHERRTITYAIRRFSPERDKKPYWERFDVPVVPGMTVLEGLHWIKEHKGPSLAMRFSCRMGVCGSCGMLINGVPRLACNTQILHVTESLLTVAPLPNFRIIKDLVPDLMPLFDKHTHVMPHIVRDEDEEQMESTGEYFQSPEELVEYLQFSYCIKCACCMAACPTLATDDDYLGPQALPQSYRYSIDTRDTGFKQRVERVSASNGVSRCHYAGECSHVCPKGVDPARAIQLLKRRLVLDYLKLLKKKKPCKVLGKPEHADRREGIPDPPPYTV